MLRLQQQQIQQQQLLQQQQQLLQQQMQQQAHAAVSSSNYPKPNKPLQQIAHAQEVCFCHRLTSLRNRKRTHKGCFFLDA